MSVRAPDADSLREAGRLLKEGQLVVFPTETVYGLGANALDPAAVARIFAAKGRPSDNPVIVHVASVEAAKKLVAAWPPLADRLARALWPGPLTLVLPRAPHVPDAVTGGLGSVAVRVPAHPVAQAVLRACGVPLAAPSANTSGRPSPTTAQHAEMDLGDKVQLYLDGGPTEHGVESTVVSLLGPLPVVLRSGAVPREALEKLVKEWGKPGGGPAVSPGMKYRHYAPKAKVRILSVPEIALAWRKQGGDPRVAFIVAAETAAGGMAGRNVAVPGGRGDGTEWARELFALLRKFDKKDEIVVEAIPEKGLGAAVMERLRKAAEPAPPAAAMPNDK
ncbi:MAG: L-threonylcarbamoyladenylate synthase [Thermoplasmata archaeon]|jgi:L-threonylcarbamoyladenylate synthase|nr:L-threonylcarbamoyladenylate synthase [Thermoplasmata archaeon]